MVVRFGQISGHCHVIRLLYGYTVVVRYRDGEKLKLSFARLAEGCDGLLGCGPERGLVPGRCEAFGDDEAKASSLAAEGGICAEGESDELGALTW